MPEHRVELTAAALRHMEGIAEYHLEKVGPRSAEIITDKLLAGLAILERYPFSGPEHPDPVLARRGYRKLVLEGYVAVYRQEEDAVYVYGIFHGATNYPALFK